MTQSTDVQLPELEAQTKMPAEQGGEGEIKRTASDLEAVFDVPVNVSAVLGKSTMEVNKLLKLARGMVVEIDRQIGEAIDISVNDRLVAPCDVGLLEAH